MMSINYRLNGCLIVQLCKTFKINCQFIYDNTDLMLNVVFKNRNIKV